MMQPWTMRLPGGRLYEAREPLVMAIINATPDSFYASSRTAADQAVDRARRMVADGADILDIGACSTRPGSSQPTAREEIERLRPVVTAIKEAMPEVPISIDTYRADVARAAVEEMGADIVNDISAGLLDLDMIKTVAALGTPYIMMHMRGTPATMSTLTDYPRGVVADVIDTMSRRLLEARDAGIADNIMDPGFGFAKTVEQNYELLRSLPLLIDEAFPGVPMLVGVSRKTMFWKPMGLTPDDVLPATIAAGTYAMMAGASILRVHDPAAAAQSRFVVNSIGHNTLCPITL